MIERRHISRAAPPNESNQQAHPNGSNNKEPTKSSPEQKPNDIIDQDCVELGREAWNRLKNAGRKSWDNWKLIGHALMVGRQEAMALAGTNKPSGKRYTEAFHFWLQARSFDEIDKADRAKLLSIMSNLERYEAWRAKLTDAQRASWNHPAKIWQVARCKTRGIDALNQDREINPPVIAAQPAQAFQEDDEEMVWQRGLILRAKKAIGDARLHGHWLLPEPPDAGLIATVQEAVEEWRNTLNYLKDAHEKTSEELAATRDGYEEIQRQKVERREAKNSQSRQAALEGAE